MNSIRTASDNDALVGSVVVGTVARLMYCTDTCWRLKCGFLGLTARTMTRTTMRETSKRKESKRSKQQQQPRIDADEDDDVEDGM